MTSETRHRIRHARSRHILQRLQREPSFPGRVGTWAYCEHCSRQYKVKVGNARYCTDRCRKNWHNNHVQSARKRGVK